MHQVTCLTSTSSAFLHISHRAFKQKPFFAARDTHTEAIMSDTRTQELPKEVMLSKSQLLYLKME